jgi:thiol-disulfide isomerase/thioredoxin
MNLVKKLSIALLAICPVLQGCAAEELQWITDLPKAQAQAKSENKLVYIDFNGSDWCAPCKQLRGVLSSSKAFAGYAKTNLVLVDIDFPQRKEQSEQLKSANQALSKKYNIEGFPTVIVLNGEGKELKREVGFGGQSADELIAELEKLKKKS